MTLEKPTNEQQLAKRYSEQLQQLVERKKQIDDQIKLLQGAMLGLNELMEMNRAAAVPPPPPAMVISGDEEDMSDAETQGETPPQA